MTTVVEQPTSDAQPPTHRPPTHRPRWPWAVAAALALILVAGAVTGTLWHRRYAHAPSLDVEGGAYAPLGAHPGYHFVQVGDIDAGVFPVDPNREVGFEVWVHNPSSVTQTILGTTPSGLTSERNRVLISKLDPSVRGANEGPLTTSPVDVPPDGYRAVHYFWKTTVCWQRDKSETMRNLYLRVRVGGTTKVEQVPFDSEIVIVFQGTSRTC